MVQWRFVNSLATRAGCGIQGVHAVFTHPSQQQYRVFIVKILRESALGKGSLWKGNGREERGKALTSIASPVQWVPRPSRTLRRAGHLGVLRRFDQAADTRNDATGWQDKQNSISSIVSAFAKNVRTGHPWVLVIEARSKAGAPDRFSICRRLVLDFSDVQ